MEQIRARLMAEDASFGLKQAQESQKQKKPVAKEKPSKGKHKVYDDLGATTFVGSSSKASQKMKDKAEPTSFKRTNARDSGNSGTVVKKKVAAKVEEDSSDEGDVSEDEMALKDGDSSYIRRKVESIVGTSSSKGKEKESVAKKGDIPRPWATTSTPNPKKSSSSSSKSKSKTSLPVADDKPTETKSRPRPKPVAAKSSTKPTDDDSAAEIVASTPAKKTRERPKPKPRTKIQSSDEEKEPAPSKGKKSKTIILTSESEEPASPKPQPFPFAYETNKRRAERDSELDSEPAGFPMDLTPKPKKKTADFPMQFSPGHRSRTHASSSELRGDDVQAFPMDLSSPPRKSTSKTPKMLMKIVKHAPLAISVANTKKAGRLLTSQSSTHSMHVSPAKRSSSSPDGRGRLSKKLKLKEFHEDAPTDKETSSEDDVGLPDIGLSHEPVADPSTLCPFCDEVLPEHPTADLIAQLEILKRESKPDPRYGNALGRKAPIRRVIPFCRMHTFEVQSVPEAAKNGWPTNIDFGAVPTRLWKKKDNLQKFVDCPEDSPFFQKSSREIQRTGSRVAMGVRGQFASFEQSQPGYYGEQGMIIIHQTLMDMFPSIDPFACAPMVPNDFILQVLVPEAGRVLIREDMGVNKAEALTILMKSRKYGLMQFPDRDNAGDDLTNTALSMRVKIGREIAMREEEEFAKTDAESSKRATKKSRLVSSDANRKTTLFPDASEDSDENTTPRATTVQKGKGKEAGRSQLNRSSSFSTQRSHSFSSMKE